MHSDLINSIDAPSMTPVPLCEPQPQHVRGGAPQRTLSRRVRVVPRSVPSVHPPRHRQHTATMGAAMTGLLSRCACHCLGTATQYSCVDCRGRPPAPTQAHDNPPGPWPTTQLPSGAAAAEPARGGGGGDDRPIESLCMPLPRHGDSIGLSEAEAAETELEALVQAIGAQGGATSPSPTSHHRGVCLAGDCLRNVCACHKAEDCDGCRPGPVRGVALRASCADE
jgi:hypothetical protein